MCSEDAKCGAKAVPDFIQLFQLLPKTKVPQHAPQEAAESKIKQRSTSRNVSFGWEFLTTSKGLNNISILSHIKQGVGVQLLKLKSLCF